MRCFVNGRKKGGNRSDSMDEQIKAAYGYTDRQLEQEMDYAISHPDASPELNPPEDEFQRILSKAEQLQREADQKAAASRIHRRINRGKMVRLALAAAILGTLSVGGVVSVVGRSGFRYDKIDVGDGGEVIIWRNTPVVEKESDGLQEAYNEISDELNIPVLKMNYVPAEMKFREIIFDDKRAILKFDYNGYIIRLVEISDMVTMDNRHVSDREYFDEEYFRGLGAPVSFSKNELAEGKTEYSAEIMRTDAYYYISGIMEEDVLRNIVEQMYFD